MNNATTKLVDSLIVSALEKSDSELAEKMPPESEIASKHTFSSAFENTMQKLIQSEENRNKSKKLKRFSFRFAVALVSIFLTLIILAVCAGAFHIDIFAEISRFAEKYLSIEFSSNKKEGNGVIYDTSSIPSDWESYWAPGYIPKGYNLVSAAGTFQKRFVFKDTNGNSIIFLQWFKDKNIFSDTEDTEQKEIEILNTSGYLLKKNTEAGTYIIVTWVVDDTVFKIEGVADEKEIIKIAENIIFYKK